MQSDGRCETGQGRHMTDQQVDAEPAHQPHATTREPRVGKFVKEHM